MILAITGIILIVGMLGWDIPELHAAKKFLSIATTQSGTSWYMLGGGMVQVINKNIPNVEANAEVTGGAGENCTLVQKKKVDMGFSGDMLVFWAQDGLYSYKEKHPDLRILICGQINIAHFVVPEKSPLRSLMEAKGKRIGVGQPGSGNQMIAKQVFDVFGLSHQSDYKPLYLTFIEQVSAIRDGHCDLGVMIAGVPSPPILDLQSSHVIRFIEITDEEYGKIQQKYPWYMQLSIPANTYKSQPTPIKTIGGMSVVIAHKDMSEEIAYQIVKAVLENNEYLKSVHPAGADWSLDHPAYQQPTVVPLHPGTLRYLKEKNKIK